MINSIKDITELKELFEKYKDNYNPIINDFINVLGFKEDNRYVGFLIYQVLYENAEIIDIFVLDEYRKKGIGTKLLEKMLDNKSIKNITLEVRIDNNNAISLYNKLGFVPVTIRKGYYNGVDAILMLKEVK